MRSRLRFKLKLRTFQLLRTCSCYLLLLYLVLLNVEGSIDYCPNQSAILHQPARPSYHNNTKHRITTIATNKQHNNEGKEIYSVCTPLISGFGIWNIRSWKSEGERKTRTPLLDALTHTDWGKKKFELNIYLENYCVAGAESGKGDWVLGGGVETDLLWPHRGRLTFCSFSLPRNLLDVSEARTTFGSPNSPLTNFHWPWP